MIRLRQLEADNFRQLREVELDFPERCTILVEGENESGKSTLFEAVYFALYGKPISDADSFALVHNRAERGLVRLVFSVDGVQVEVSRNLSRGAQRVTTRAQLTVTQADGTSRSLNGIEKVNAELGVLLHGLDAEAMRHSCYVEQKGLDRTADLTVENRKSLLLKLLDQSEILAIGKQYEKAKPSEAALLRARQVVELAETYQKLNATRAAQAQAIQALNRAELAHATAQWAEHLLAAEGLEADRREHVRQADRLAGEIITAERWAGAAADLRHLAEARRAHAAHVDRLTGLEAQLADLARLVADELPIWRNRRKQVQFGEGHLAARAEADRQKQRAAARLTALGEAQHWEADTALLRREVETLSTRLGEAQRVAREAEKQHTAAVDLERLFGQARARQDALLTLQKDVTAVQLLADQVQALEVVASASRKSAEQASTHLANARQAHSDQATLTAHAKVLRELVADAAEVGEFGVQVGKQREAAQLARQAVGANQAELVAAQARWAEHERATTLRDWAVAQRQIVSEQKALRESLSAADQAISAALSGKAAATQTAQRASGARWWALAAGGLAVLALVAASIVAFGRLPLLIDARWLALGLTGAGLVLVAIGIIVGRRGARRTKQARERALALEAQARAQETARATNQGALSAYEQKAVGLLAPTRAKFVALSLSEPADLDAAEARVAELLTKVGEPESLPDPAALTQFITEADVKVAALEADLARDNGVFAEQARQMTRRLEAEGWREPAQAATALAEIEVKAAQFAIAAPPVADLDLRAKAQNQAAVEAAQAHQRELATLNERDRTMRKALAAAGVASAAALPEALSAAQHTFELAEAQGAPDVPGAKVAWEQAVAAERAVSAEHGSQSGELRGREMQLATLLAGVELATLAEVEAAVLTVHQQVRTHTEAQATAEQQLGDALTTLGWDGQTEPSAWLISARTDVDAQILNAEARLKRQGEIEAERGRVIDERDRQLGLVDNLEVDLTAKRAADASLPEPTIGEELQLAEVLERRYQSAGVSVLREAERQAREQAGGAVQNARQARAEADAERQRAAKFLAELGQPAVPLVEPSEVRQHLPDLPEAPTPQALEQLAGHCQTLGYEVAGYEQQCKGLQAQLGQEPSTLDLAVERARLTELERQARVSRVAAKIIERARTNVINQLVPATLDNACLFLPVLTSGRYHDAVLDERSFQLKVWDASFKRMVEREVFSGGAQDQFALALRLGFALAALPQELGAAPAFIFLDEPVASFDRIRRDAFVSLVRGGLIGERFDQIFVAEPEGIFPENPFPHYVRMEGGRIVARQLT